MEYPSLSARTPRPLMASNSATAGRESPRSSADLRIPLAMVCSESPSIAAAMARALSWSQPSTVAIPTTPNSPLVSVPVLSKITVSISRACSSARRSRTRMPLLAPMAVEIATTSGMASPSAWGQAITSTVATRAITSTLKPTAIVQATAVTAAAPRAI